MEYIDLKAQYKALKGDIDSGISKVLNGADFILGSAVKEFEKNLAEYVGVRHVIACSDGTAALQLIYMAHGIGKGDAVFCPDMTFIASIEPACLLGATPVFCEIDDISYNISPESLERQIKAVIREGSLKPRAVIAVDFLGNPADFDALRVITDRYGLLLVEDAAQAMGASYKGRRCGSLGDIAATSFFPSKPLGCYGDGGAVFTDDDEIAEILRSLRVHGRGEDKYHNVRIGINSRLDSIQAAILGVKLKDLAREIDIRQDVADKYTGALSGILKCPGIAEGSISAYAQYVVLTKDQEMRGVMQEKLKASGIPSIRYYPVPMHLLPVFNETETYGESFDVTVRYADCSFGIPFSAYLTPEDQQTVIECLSDRES